MIPSLNHGIVEFSHSILFLFGLLFHLQILLFLSGWVCFFCSKNELPITCHDHDKQTCGLWDGGKLCNYCGKVQVSFNWGTRPCVVWPPINVPYPVGAIHHRDQGHKHTHTHTHAYTHTQSWFLAFVDLNHCSYICTICWKAINLGLQSLCFKVQEGYEHNSKNPQNVCIMKFQCYCPDTKHETQSSSSSWQRYHVL